ncbi:MAG: RluA family pseudouridine synthase [Salibacteraceae bacterium]
MSAALEPEEESDENNYYEHHRVQTDPGQQLMRIDKFLVDRLPNLSRNRIQNAAKAGCILVNGNPVKPNYKIKPLDDISLVMPYPKQEFELVAEAIPLEIVFEDADLLVLYKPAGLVVHPGHGNYSGTLVNGLLHHLDGLPHPDADPVRPGLVHRLDKDTSGVMVIAKSELAHTHLARQFFDRTVDRRYTALVWGELEEEEGTITGHIGRSRKNRKVMDVYPDGSFGKHAVTHYKVLKRLGYVTLVECKLETGRTHQIRAHFRHLRHPLFGDLTYEGDRIWKGTSFTKYKQFIQNCFQVLPRQALHAKTLDFTHPKTGERLHFEAPMPDDFQEVLDKWDTYVRSVKS